MSPRRIRHSRSACSDGGSPPRTRRKAIQRSMNDIPVRMIPTWGERWPTNKKRSRQSLNEASGEAGVPQLPFEQGLSEFQLDTYPTMAGEYDPSGAPIAHSSRGRSRKNRRERMRTRSTPYITPLQPEHQPSSPSGGSDEPGQDSPSSSNSPGLLFPEQFIAPIQVQDPPLMTHPFPPRYPGLYEDQVHMRYPTSQHHAHDIPAPDLNQYFSQPFSQAANPQSPANPTFNFYQLSPDNAFYCVQGSGTGYLESRSIPPTNHDGPGANQYYSDTMVPEAFSIHPQNDPSTF